MKNYYERTFNTGVGVPGGFPGVPGGFPGAPGGFPGAPGGFGGLSAAQQQQYAQLLPTLQRPTTPPPQALVNIYNSLVSNPQLVSQIASQRPQSLFQLSTMLGMPPIRGAFDVDNPYTSGDERIDGIWFCRYRWALIFYQSPFGGISVSLCWVAYVDSLVTIAFCYPGFTPSFFFTPYILFALC